MDFRHAAKITTRICRSVLPRGTSRTGSARLWGLGWATSPRRRCASGGRCRGRPVARQQRSEVVTIVHARQTREDVPQVGERVFAVALTRDDDRVEDGGALSGVGMADEQRVFLADAGRARNAAQTPPASDHSRETRSPAPRFAPAAGFVAPADHVSPRPRSLPFVRFPFRHITCLRSFRIGGRRDTAYRAERTVNQRSRCLSPAQREGFAPRKPPTRSHFTINSGQSPRSGSPSDIAVPWGPT